MREYILVVHVTKDYEPSPRFFVDITRISRVRGHHVFAFSALAYSVDHLTSLQAFSFLRKITYKKYFNRRKYVVDICLIIYGSITVIVVELTV